MSKRHGNARLLLQLPTRQRSLLMGRVRRSGTECELCLRKALHRAGYRYRLNSGSSLPGTPDVLLPRWRVAIFVDGCFWRGCPKHGTVPKTNTEFWTVKILRNRERDKYVDRSLRALGWRVLRVWEHDVPSGIRRVIRRIKHLEES